MLHNNNCELDPTFLPQCIGRIHLYSDMWRYFDHGLYLFMQVIPTGHNRAPSVHPPPPRGTFTAPSWVSTPGSSNASSPQPSASHLSMFGMVSGDVLALGASSLLENNFFLIKFFFLFPSKFFFFNSSLPPFLLFFPPSLHSISSSCPSPHRWKETPALPYLFSMFSRHP